MSTLRPLPAPRWLRPTYCLIAWATLVAVLLCRDSSTTAITVAGTLASHAASLAFGLCPGEWVRGLFRGKQQP